MTIMSVLTSAKHERFAQEIAGGASASQAYVAAGYRAHRGNASALARQQTILARVGELLAQRKRLQERATERAIERTAITKQRVAEELAAIGFATTGLEGDPHLDLSALSREQARALSVKRQALMDIAALFGYVIKRTEVREVDEFESLDTEQLRAKVAEIIERRAATRH
ncbi:MAG TPA: hypothetical protein VND87_17355 [Stellaceae bacterium]|nr:hypothetical protein [Stellaceae bacterium]